MTPSKKSGAPTAPDRSQDGEQRVNKMPGVPDALREARLVIREDSGIEPSIAIAADGTSPDPGAPGDVRRNKRRMRRAMRTLRASLDPDHARQRSERACNALVRWVSENAHGLVALYAARKHELATLPAALVLLERGVSLAYPRVAPGQRTLHFHRIHDPHTLKPGRFDIAEPGPGDEEVALTDIALFVVPGLAFDRHGGRLGWGAGHYDASLCASPGTRVGFCFQSQIVDRVPREAHDILMDRIITDDGILDIHRTDRLPPTPAGQSTEARITDASKNR